MCQPEDYDEPAPRRSFLKRGLALAAAGWMGTRGWAAELVRPVEATDVTFRSDVGPGKAYLASPPGKGRHPAVVVMHGNLGQPDYQRRIADELARSGFVALAIERFSRFPGMTMEKLQEDGRTEKRFLSETFFQEQQREALGAVDFLRHHPKVRKGPMGAVGFCGGGIQAVRLSLRTAAIGAVVAFYGPPELPAQYKHPTDPIVDLVQIGSQVKAPLQMHYGTSDYAVKAEGVEKLAAQLRQAGTPVEAYAYEGAQHGFYQTPRPSDTAAVTLARDRYLRFLHEHLD